ncbi:MAG: glyoxylate reductase [Cellvibrionaceae bacterium]|jgi:glyoxylate reductase
MNIIISHELPAEWITSVTNKYPTTLIGPSTLDHAGLTAELKAALPQAAGLLTMLTVKVDKQLLAVAPNLKVVSQMAVGVDNIDLAACTARGIPVGHTPGVLVDATADIAMTLLLATARRLSHAAADAREGRWGTWNPVQWLGADLAGSTLGIVGLGAIGQATARRAKAFGMRIVYHSRGRYPEIEKELAAEKVSFSDLLTQSDFVSLHTPLTAETKHIIDADALQAMKKSAILINTARGGVVDQNALIVALQNGDIQAAGLDVTTPEPLPTDSPLFHLPNCLVLPHIGSATQRTRRRMAELACENLLLGLEGVPLRHDAARP